MKLSTEIVREFLDYNPDTGIFTWRVRGREWFGSDRDWKRWNTCYAGEIAGHINKAATGYPRLQITLLGKDYYGSRLAFPWMGERLPEQVDHLNRDSLDDRWSNLSASNYTENSKNKSAYRRNTSEVTGVYWNKAAGKWHARVGLNSKNYHLGLFTDIDEAAKAVATFYAANGFTDGHGQGFTKYQEGVRQ